MLPLTNPVQLFAVLALLILIVPLISRKLRIPEIAGLILAGVAFGPPLLNVLTPEPIVVLSKAGLLYIMFLAGLEIDLFQLRKQRGQALTFGLLTFLIPSLLGVVTGRLLGFSWYSAILFGSLMAPYTLVPYPIVSRLGLLRNPAVTAGVGGTFIADSLALLALAMVIPLALGRFDLSYGFRLVAGIVALVGIGFFLLPRIGRWFFRSLPGDDSAEFLFLFTALLTVASLSELAELEPIIGAFIAGLALNPLVPEQSRMMNRVRFAGSTLFIPVFLVSVGMLVDLRVFRAGAEAWLVAGTMIAVVLGAKFLAANTTRSLFHFSRDEGWVLFGLSVNKAAATLAVVLVGFNAGILNTEVLNGTILLILVSCMTGPWVTEIYGRRLALRQIENQPKPTLLQRIVVPLSNPDTADALMDIAFMIRDKTQGQPILPLSVIPDSATRYAEQVRAERMLGNAAVRAAAADILVRPETRIDTDVAAGIIRAVKELRGSCLVIGWNFRAVEPHTVFSTVLDQLLTQHQQMLLVCKIEQPVNTAQRLLLIVPPLTDRLAGFETTLKTVKNLAHQGGLNLVLVSLAEGGQELSRAVSRISPTLPCGGFNLDCWSSLWPRLAEQLRPNDLAVFISCRSGSPAWQPGLDRLPQRFCQQFPRTSLIVAYPAETVPDSVIQDDTARSMVSLTGLLRPDNLSFGLDLLHYRDAIKLMLQRYFASRDDVPADKIERLSVQLAQAGVEITTGVVLFHVHCAEVKQSVVLLGVSPRGLTVPEISPATHGVMILLSPVGCLPEEHLRALSDIAKLVLGTPRIKDIGNVASGDDLARLFQSG